MSWMFRIVLPLALLAGCQSAQQKRWTVEPVSSAEAPSRPMEGGDQQLFSATRVGSVVVAAPYDNPQFQVRRADGTDAADPYNVFSASPSALLRSPVQSYLRADGRLGHVVPQGSVVSTDAQVEVQVRRLSLDCRQAGERTACADISVDFVRTGRGPRTVAYSGTGSARVEVDAQDRNYSRAFSEAFYKALDTAVNDALPPRRK